MSDPLLTQLKRIRGQIDGVIAMYEQDRGCIEIVRQMMATRNSLTSVAREMFLNKAKRCSVENNVEELDDILKEMFKYT